MQFWQGGFVVDVLLLAALFAGWLCVRSAIGPWWKGSIPDAIVVGLIGFALGPQALNLLPFEYSPLEVLVYHGLAIVFIAVALQSRPRAPRSPDTRSMAFAMPILAAVQAVCGLGLVIAWSTWSNETVHPGFGLLLPLGFQQGPGQALSLGSAWETSGLAQGAALGLGFAATGFLVCAVIGIPAVALVQRRSMNRDDVDGPQDAAEVVDGPQADRSTLVESTTAPLSMLTLQVVIIGTVYLMTYGVLLVVTGSLPVHQGSMVWGLHFVVAAGIALLTRAALGQQAERLLDDRLLGAIGNLVVDFTTTAALVAVQVQLLGPWMGLFLATSILGAVVTGSICWLVAPKMFRQARRHHAVVLFGTATGTLPTGLALLKMMDPQLRGPAARSVVLATPGAVVLGLPLLLVVMPAALSGWPNRGLDGAWSALGILAAYLLVLSVGWGWTAGIGLRRRA